MFPERTDRVVLDSNDDPDPGKVARAWLANYAAGVEDRFPDFARWAADRAGDYGLGADPAAVRRTVIDLAARLDREPVPGRARTPAGAERQRAARTRCSARSTPTRTSPRWPPLMKAALTGSPLPAPNTPPDPVVQNSAAATAATMCNDVGVAPLRPPARAAGSPATGPPIRSPRACRSTWGRAPSGSTGPPSRPSDHLAGAVQRAARPEFAGDPSTPYSGAVKMREAFGQRARMVSVDSGGHGAYLANGNACGDRAVTEFLVSGPVRAATRAASNLGHVLAHVSGASPGTGILVAVLAAFTSVYLLAGSSSRSWRSGSSSCTLSAPAAVQAPVAAGRAGGGLLHGHGRPRGLRRAPRIPGRVAATRDPVGGRWPCRSWSRRSHRPGGPGDQLALVALLIYGSHPAHRAGGRGPRRPPGPGDGGGGRGTAADRRRG